MLLVVGDVPLAATFAALVDEPETSYALALLLRMDDGPGGVRLRLDGGVDVARARRWPDAVEFLRWLEEGEAELSLATGARRWRFDRQATVGSS